MAAGSPGSTGGYVDNCGQSYAACAGAAGVTTPQGTPPNVFAIGGISGATRQTAVYKSAITGSDLGAFSTTSQGQLPVALTDLSANQLVIGTTGYLYVLGGNSAGGDVNTVYKSTFDSSNNVGAFSTASQGQLPVALSQHSSATSTINSTNYIYVLGGTSSGTAQSTVYKATIDGSGNIGAFSSSGQSALPQALYSSSVFATTIGSNNYLYAVGGKNSSNVPIDTIYRGTLDSSGNVTGWVIAGTLPQVLASHVALSATTGGNNYAYVFGGENASTPVSTVYRGLINDMTGYRATRDLVTPVNLSNKNSIQFDVYSSVTGSYTAFEISEDNSTWTACADNANFTSGVFSISSANTWETKTCDISGVASASKDAIRYLRFRITTTQTSNVTSYFDNIYAYLNAGTISNSSTVSNGVMGASNITVNAQGTGGAIQLNYDPSNGLAGSGGMRVYDGGIGLLFSVNSTGTASAAGGLTFTGASASAQINALNGQNLTFKTSAGGDAGLTTRMTLLNSGQLGIGTANPLATLDVLGVSSTTPIASLSGNTPIAGMVVNNNSTRGDIFTASSSGLARFVIQNNGNVGVGDTLPNHLLTVKGQSNSSIIAYSGAAIAPFATYGTTIGAFDDGSGTNKFASILLGQSAANFGGMKWLYNATPASASLNMGTFSSQNLSLVTNATTAMTIDTGQKVGFGNTTPAGKLDVLSNLGTLPIASLSGNTSFAGLVANNNSTRGDIFTASASGTTRFVIQNNGNIGIGTSLPTASLDINPGTQTAINISQTSNITTANLVNVNHTSTYNSNSADSGNIMNLSRSLTAGFTNDTVTFDASSSGTISGTSSAQLTWIQNTGSGNNRYLVVGVSLANTTVKDVTYGGSAMTLLGSVGPNPYTYLYGLANPSSGAKVVYVTTNGATNYLIGGATSFTNVAQTNSTGSFVSFAGGSTNPSVTVPSATGEMVVDSLSVNAVGAAVTPGGGQTARWLNPGGTNLSSGGSTKPGAASVTMSWTTTSTLSYLGAISLHPSATTPTTLTLSGALANLSSNCGVVAGSTCTDSANILALTQSNGLGTGAVLNINNLGLGSGINLTSNSGGQAAFVLNDTGSGPLFVASSGGVTKFIIGNDGSTGVGTATPSARFQVGDQGDGTVAVANSWNGFSDVRFKTNINPLQDALSKVLSLVGVSFNWRNSGQAAIGFIAQDVEKIVPEIVTTDANGFKSMDYGKVTPLLVNAIHETESQILDLKSQNASLSAKMDKLETINFLPFSQIASGSSMVTIKDSLLVLGSTTTNDLSVGNSISVGNTMQIGANSINTVGQDLEIQPLKQGAISLMGGAVRIETDGTLKVAENAEFAKDVKVGGVLSAQTINIDSNTLPTYSSDTEVSVSESAGFLVLRSGYTQLKVNDPKVTSKSLIFLTPKQTIDNPLFVKEQVSGKYFIVGVKSAPTTNIDFNFLIIN